MQELIEQLKELKGYAAVTHGLERSLPYQTAIDYAETMLKKEKEAIISYAHDWATQEMFSVTRKEVEEDFDKTFNTKEK